MNVSDVSPSAGIVGDLLDACIVGDGRLTGRSGSAWTASILECFGAMALKSVFNLSELCDSDDPHQAHRQNITVDGAERLWKINKIKTTIPRKKISNNI